MTSTTITIARSLDLAEINTANGFSHACVIDTRTRGGLARPIEECVLKRLKSHFVEYTQMPVEFGNVGPCVEVDLCETLTEQVADTLVLGDDLTQLSALLSIYNIRFRSNDLYVVETGKGEEVRRMGSVPATPHSVEAERFGALGN